MRVSDIRNLSAQQIKDLWAIPDLPTHWCYVNVPAGTWMWNGIASNNAFGFGHAIQFEVTNYLESWFSGTYTLPLN